MIAAFRGESWAPQRIMMSVRVVMVNYVRLLRLLESWSMSATRDHDDARRGCTHPFQTLVQTVARGCTRRLDVPRPLTERVEAELVGDLGGVHGVGQILSCSAQNHARDRERRTCLLAKTSNNASLSSSSLSIRCTVSSVHPRASTFQAHCTHSLPVLRRYAPCRSSRQRR